MTDDQGGPAIKWPDLLGLIPWLVVVSVTAFVTTKHLWFDTISADNKALFWTNLVTALATLGLFSVAVIAAAVAWRQLREFQRGTRIVATTDLLREWSQEKYQNLLHFIDFSPDALWNRKYARRLYYFVTSDEQIPPKREREKRAKFRERERFVEGMIQELSLMATRTWNLLEKGVIDENVLFGQLDYDIVAAYYELENVLAVRQVEDNQLYAEFTRLAQRAHKHYLRRPENEINEDFVGIVFDGLPFDDDDFDRYMALIIAQERAERELERLEEAEDSED